MTRGPNAKSKLKYLRPLIRCSCPRRSVEQTPSDLRCVDFSDGGGDQLTRVLVEGCASGNQGFSIRQYGQGFSAARGIQIPGARPSLRRRVPQLGGIDAFGDVMRQFVHGNEASRDQHLACLE